MPQPFDHLVLAARDLAGQAEAYARLGFQVGARNQHPWGTQNQLVQLDGAFLELVGLAEGARMPPVHPAPRQFSFGGFVGQYLAGQEGLAMLVLRSGDAKADAARFAAAGIGNFEPFHFTRSASRPDGSRGEVAFTLAFAESSLMPEAGFFTCQHHFPENFWAPALQLHPNSAQKLAGAVMVAENPADHAEFLAHFLGQRLMLSTSMGLELDTGGGKVEVLTPLAAQFRYGAHLGGAGKSAPHFAGYRIVAGDMAQVQAALARGNLRMEMHHNCIVVPAAAACGAAVIFEPRDKA